MEFRKMVTITLYAKQKKRLYIFNLFLTALGLRCCAWALCSCREPVLLFISVCRLLIVVASLVAEHRL